MSAAGARPVRHLDPDAVVWTGPRESDAPLVVFMHGFGGDEHDWTPYFDRLPDGVAGAALRGPVPLGERWAWVDFGSEGLGALSAAARGVHEWLETVGPRSVVLVGWSQGAATALHVARQRPASVAAVSMAGGFIWEYRPHAGLRDRRLPVWYGIGAEDEVIPRRMVASARRWLEGMSQAELRSYPATRHELKPEIADDAIAFALRHLR